MTTISIDTFSQLEQVVINFLSQIQPPQCVALHGNLGSGKTAFAKSLLCAMGYGGLVTSPTFSLVEEYTVNNTKIFHLDLYRLNSIEEALMIGIEEIVDSNALVLIEWPEIIENLLPHDTINLYFSYSNQKRVVKYE